MTTILRALVAVLVVAGTSARPAAAADTPNFSGDWTMNVARSKFAGMPPPTSLTRKVTHAEPSLVIVEEQVGGLGSGATRKYTTDGKETSFESDGAEVKTSAVWDGDALMVVSHVPIAGLQFVDRMTLSEDGKVMTSAVHITSPQGEVDITIVFDRK